METIMTKDSKVPVEVGMVANAPAPKPDPSPVCVESVTLKWARLARPWSVPMAECAFGVYEVYQEGGMLRARLVNEALFAEHQKARVGETFPTFEAAQAACQADFTRRILELVNARSVESVKAERDRELIEIFAAKSQEIDQSDGNGRALALSYVNAVQCLRSNTGEG